MSIWWVRKEQLDKDQIGLIEDLPFRESFLVLGPPGSGKTNVLVRRAQYVRSQGLPNVLVLNFTRSLVEFVKTGCYDQQKREIFPQSCVNTIESWIRELYAIHKEALPPPANDLVDWKRGLATGALGFIAKKRLPQYETLFVDEAQDLLVEEVELIKQWSPTLFFAGDDRQKIWTEAEGLSAVRQIKPAVKEKALSFHYRVAPEICEVADRILVPTGGKTLASTSHYDGPKPATVTIQEERLVKDLQIERAAAKLKEQIRAYADLIKGGDRLGVVVSFKDDRELVFRYFEKDPLLKGKSKIMRARNENERDYDPSFDVDTPIAILTLQGCKGLEFRAVHWLFSDDLADRHNPEHYYTVVTRAKTSLDIYYTRDLPQTLARAHTRGRVSDW